MVRSSTFQYCDTLQPFIPSFSLKDFIEWHLDNKGHEPVTGLDELPKDVKLKHVINAWGTSVELWDSYLDKRDAASA